MENGYTEFKVSFLLDLEETDDFDCSTALGILLANDVVFLNDHWWKGNTRFTDEVWPPDACKTVSLNVNCSDTFAYASADAEEVSFRELQDLFIHWLKDKEYGSMVWCAKKRNEMPLKPHVDNIQAMGLWDLNSLGLKPNQYEKRYSEN